jgi:hypothetical protein
MIGQGTAEKSGIPERLLLFVNRAKLLFAHVQAIGQLPFSFSVARQHEQSQ